MPMCCVFNCSDRNGGHTFPKDPIRRKQWVHAVRRLNFKPSARAIVCYKHFSAADYSCVSETTGEALVNKKLKKTAVPSIFPWKKDILNELAEPRSIRLHSRCAVKELPSNVQQIKSEPTLLVDNSDLNECIKGASGNEEVIEVLHFAPPRDFVSEVEVRYGVQADINTPLSLSKKTIPKKNKGECSKSVSTFTQTNAITLQFLSVQKLFSQNGKFVSYYTGLDSFDKFMLSFYSLGSSAYQLQYRYSHVKNLAVENQYLLTLVKLRRNEPDFGLSQIFSVSEKTVSNVLITWINFMALEWSEIELFPSRQLVDYYMPEGFKKAYPSTRIIIDGTEIKILKPKDPLAQQACFSTYKNCCTIKEVVGATPAGLICWCSDAYAGSTSDRAIIERSNLIHICDKKDSIMADRGFTIQDLFAPKDIAINIPSFMEGRSQIFLLTGN